MHTLIDYCISFYFNSILLFYIDTQFLQMVHKHSFGQEVSNPV